MFDMIKDYIVGFFKSRLFVLIAVMIILFGILVQRVFTLQILNGETYLNNYTLRIEKERELKSSRGNIYDRNGTLLAYNELAYSITIEDNGSYDTTDEKNVSLNKEIATIIETLDTNNDVIENNFNITLNEDNTYEFNVTGRTLQRFLADVYGRSSVDDLDYNKKLGYNEAEATPNQVMEYLMGSTRFNIASSYKQNMAYRITVIRYALSQNSFQKYISTNIATNVSEETVAYISEHASSLQGVSVADDTIRKYVDSKYYAHLIGYTGMISQSEYDTFSSQSENYTLTDVVGKSGIEQYMDTTLQGVKGFETVYVDNLGKVVETKERTEPIAGNNVYLSIDANLQKVAYQLLEQQLAGILFDKIENIKNYDVGAESSASDIIIPIDNVYNALIKNNLLDISHFSAADASDSEQAMYQAFESKEESVISSLSAELKSDAPTAFGLLPEESRDYITYLISMMRTNEILLTKEIDTTDATYVSWAAGTLSLKEYLNYAISKNWIDISTFNLEEKYSDSDQVYSNLVDYLLESLADDNSFAKIIYQYMIEQNMISGTQLCLALFDQGILDYDEASVQALTSGSSSSYNFLKSKIKSLEITPAQLALDPCSASTVVTDTDTGEILALVSYPGYDNNRLANKVDAAYYAKLTSDLSNPLYNNATQERTAPGSTFKMVTAVAGLAEGVITTTEEINDEGEFTKVNPSPKCWIYPSSHGLINVSEALRDSCNYFFYEIGYRLSANGESINDAKGISAIQKYAKLFGLGESTGIEISENDPQIANEYPITASIGQSNNNYTTTELSRYITAVANSGTVYNYTLLKQVTDANNTVIETYEPTVKEELDVLDTIGWDAIHSGMRMVVENLTAYKDFPISVAGKTGTAQQVVTRPNHALFVGYAPFEDPEISIATRIAYGYTSHNSAAVSKDIISYYFGVKTEDELVTGQATDVNESENRVVD